MKKRLIIILMLLPSEILFAQTINGKIIDENGTGLPDLQVTIYITSNTYITTTTSDGSFTFLNITGVEKESLPEGYIISNNYPNPFNPKTRFDIAVQIPSVVEIKLINILGQSVTNVIEKHFNPGYNYFDLDLNGLSNGVYFAHININNRYFVARKLILLYGTEHLIGSNPNQTSKYTLNKAISSSKIDSIVVIGPYIEKKIVADLPPLQGTLLDLGNIVVHNFIKTNRIYHSQTYNITDSAFAFVRYLFEKNNLSLSDFHVYQLNTNMGSHHVNCHQIYNGLEVFPDNVTLTFDNNDNFIYLGGKLINRITIDTIPMVASSNANILFCNKISSDRWNKDSLNSFLNYGFNAQLVLYDLNVGTNFAPLVVLTWKLTVANGSEYPVGYIRADSLSLIYYFNGIIVN